MEENTLVRIQDLIERFQTYLSVNPQWWDYEMSDEDQDESIAMKIDDLDVTGTESNLKASFEISNCKTYEKTLNNISVLGVIAPVPNDKHGAYFCKWTKTPRYPPLKKVSVDSVAEPRPANTLYLSDFPVPNKSTKTTNYILQVSNFIIIDNEQELKQLIESLTLDGHEMAIENFANEQKQSIIWRNYLPLCLQPP